MLRTFTCGRTFNKLEAVLHVDCMKKDAEVVIMYDRRIRRIEAVPFHEVSEPQLADRWFSKSASVEHGSWLEFHAMMCARDPKWLVNEEPPPRGVVVDGRHVEVLDEHATLDEQVRDGLETLAQRNACGRYRKDSGVWVCARCAIQFTGDPDKCHSTNKVIG